MTNATLSRIICGLWLSFLVAACASSALQDAAPPPSPTLPPPTATHTLAPTVTPTVEPTATPPPTFTPEPTATPAEAGPKSCSNEESIKQIVDAYLEAPPEHPKAPFTSLEDMSVESGLRGSNLFVYGYMTEARIIPAVIQIENAILLGMFKIDLPKAMDGTALCMVFVYDDGGEAKTLSVITDATVRGVRGRSVIYDDTIPYDIWSNWKDPDVVQWVKDNIGIRVNVKLFIASTLDGIRTHGTFTDDDGINRSGLRPLAEDGYPLRFENDPDLVKQIAGSSAHPELQGIAQYIHDQGEPGLIAANVSLVR